MQSTSKASYKSVPTIEDVEKRQALEASFGRSAYRSRASKAGKMRAFFAQSYAANCMIFQQFEKPATRNKILRELNLPPITTPFDPKPKKSNGKAKPRRTH